MGIVVRMPISMTSVTVRVEMARGQAGRLAGWRAGKEMNNPPPLLGFVIKSPNLHLAPVIIYGRQGLFPQWADCAATASGQDGAAMATPEPAHQQSANLRPARPRRLANAGPVSATGGASPEMPAPVRRYLASRQEN